MTEPKTVRLPHKVLRPDIPVVRNIILIPCANVLLQLDQPIRIGSNFAAVAHVLGLHEFAAPRHHGRPS